MRETYRFFPSLLARPTYMRGLVYDQRGDLRLRGMSSRLQQGHHSLPHWIIMSLRFIVNLAVLVRSFPGISYTSIISSHLEAKPYALARIPECGRSPHSKRCTATSERSSHPASRGTTHLVPSFLRVHAFVRGPDDVLKRRLTIVVVKQVAATSAQQALNHLQVEARRGVRHRHHISRLGDVQCLMHTLHDRRDDTGKTPIKGDDVER